MAFVARRSVAVFRRSWSWKPCSCQSSSFSQDLSSTFEQPVSSSTTGVSSSVFRDSVQQGRGDEAPGESGTYRVSSSRTRKRFFKSGLSQLNDVKPRQFLTTNEKTIVCVHPLHQTSREESKPLRPYKPELDKQRTSLTDDEVFSMKVDLVKKLRREDGSLWTINTLARLFNVKRVVISKVAPASLERQEELKKEEEFMASMKFYKRKLYKAEREMARQKRLEKIISQNEKLSSIRARHQNTASN